MKVISRPTTLFGLRYVFSSSTSQTRLEFVLTSHVPSSQFWELPETAEDISTLFSQADIRRTRDHSFANLEALIRAVIGRLFHLRDHPSFPDIDLAPERQLLNCVRILTRLLPFLYEVDHLEQWEDNFFWRRRESRSPPEGRTGKDEVLFDSKDDQGDPAEDVDDRGRPLGEELVDSLIDLLFYAGFTVPRSATAKTKITYAIWQSGVGCHTSLPTSKEFEKNRCELLRLLITIVSKSMYMPARKFCGGLSIPWNHPLTSVDVLPVKGTRALTYLVTCPDKQVVLSVLCSLLNTVRLGPQVWWFPPHHLSADTSPF